MSLINNLLKDLEKRKQHEQTQPYLLLSNHQETKKTFFSNPYFWGLLILGLMTSIIFFNVALKRKPVVIVEPTLIKTSKPRLSPFLTLSKHDEALLGPVTITGLTFDVKNKQIQFSFLLDHMAHYRVSYTPNHHQLIISFLNAKLTAEIPKLRYLNTGIKTVTSKIIDENLQFNLYLEEDAVIQNISVTPDDKNPALLVTIRMPLDADKPSATSNFVKTPAIQSLMQTKYKQALSDASNGLYQPAITHLQELIKFDPSYHEARVSLIALLLDQGNLLEANKILEAGLKINPTYLAFVELKARVLTHAGKVDQALLLLLNAAPPIAANPEYHAFIAALYGRSNNEEMAIKLYKKLVQIHPDNSNWWLGLGVALEKSNLLLEAKTAYGKALLAGRLSGDAIAFLQTRLKSMDELPHATD
ncbi:MAG: tetratricopeptide repeat protein [Gammaproteobacteria bacterium]|nr:tetratricopeptide repeat protein [Gammaproteobacteria bacterium]